jgi:hypothetical protein
MKFPKEHIEALQSFGYTEIEARFIYIVATHSGYFTVRQFLDFAKAKRGKRSDKLSDKLVSNKHASAEMLRKNARVYHIFSRRIYARIGKENRGSPQVTSRKSTRNGKPTRLPNLTWFRSFPLPTRIAESRSTHTPSHRIGIFIPAWLVEG